MSYETSLAGLKAILSEINMAKAQDSLMATTLFTTLHLVLSEAKNATDAELVATNNINLLDEVFSNKLIFLSKSLQIALVKIYEIIGVRSPGYAIRGVINNQLSFCNGKSTHASVRECSIAIIGKVMATRISDCGSMISDVIAQISKIAKNSELQLRTTSLVSLTVITLAAGEKIGDCHPELLKLATKFAADKLCDVRLASAELLQAIATHSAGCTSVSADLLFLPAIKGLEDEIGTVQDCFAKVVSTVFAELIKAREGEQEKAKIGQARGGESDSAKEKRLKVDRRSSMTRLKEAAASVVSNLFLFIMYFCYVILVSTNASGNDEEENCG